MVVPHRPKAHRDSIVTMPRIAVTRAIRVAVAGVLFCLTVTVTDAVSCTTVNGAQQCSWNHELGLASEKSKTLNSKVLILSNHWQISNL
jgi:hypothetical protein